jgi:thiopeptide-type bacteriocin biosynthesis protein
MANNSAIPEQYKADFFLLRTPALPLKEVLELLKICDDHKKYKDFTSKLLNNDDFLEAMYISSPEFYTQLMRLKAGEIKDSSDIKKIEFSLFKYYNRMSSRCTPFGLLAGCSLGRFGEESNIVISSGRNPHLRLDMDFLGGLSDRLTSSEAIIRKVRFYPNSSLFRFNKFYRYSERRISANGMRTYHLVKIPYEKILTSIIRSATDGIYFSGIVNIITSAGYNEEDAALYTKQLIDNQVLISEVEMNVTGKHYFTRLTGLIKERGLENEHTDKILLLASQLEIANTTREEKKIDTYQQVYRTAASLGIDVKENRLFQIDMLRDTDECRLDENIKTEVFEGIKALSRLVHFDRRQLNIEKFKRAFAERFDHQAVLLLEAVDSEIGIGYNARSTSDLIKNDTTNERNASDLFKLGKYLEWKKNGSAFIELTDEELKPFPVRIDQLSSSFNVLASIYLKEDKDPLIYLKGCSGPSATNLMGRFSFLSQDMEEKLKQACQMEESADPDKIYAEIVHLPQSRIGNILSRPRLRQYEIVYLGYSDIPTEFQIQLSDLYLVLKQGKLVLFSKKLNKEVIPRLSSAHNFRNSLPVYNLLCDLQYEDVLPSLFWDWGIINTQGRFPRVSYKNVILSRASWVLQEKQVQPGAKPGTSMLQLEEIISRESIPRYVCLTESDNEIVLDTTSKFCKEYLLKDLAKKKRLHLNELPGSEWASIVKDRDGNDYCNEINIGIVRMQSASNKDAGQKIRIDSFHSVQRVFMPGSEWLYVKIYMADKNADQVLAGLMQVLKDLERKKTIQKWFFLRYADPHFHLRIRFKLSDAAATAKVISAVNGKMAGFLQEKIIWNIQYDTYIRELERYQGKNIDLSEDFFFRDSRIILNFLKFYSSYQQQDSGKDMILYFGIISAIFMLNEFIPDIDRRLEFTEQNSKMFSLEFGLAENKALRSELGRFCRDYLKQVEKLMTARYFSEQEESPIKSEFKQMMKLAGRYTADMRALSANSMTLSDQLSSEMVTSFIHMHTNRLFPSGQRLHEFRIYYFLVKYFTSLKMRGISVQTGLAANVT